jgi:hypothetical protein
MWVETWKAVHFRIMCTAAAQCCCCARESLAFAAALAPVSKPCPISQGQHSFPPFLGCLSCLPAPRAQRPPAADTAGARVEFCSVLSALSPLSHRFPFLSPVRPSNQRIPPIYICLPAATLVSVCERLSAPFHQSGSCAAAATWLFEHSCLSMHRA